MFNKLYEITENQINVLAAGIPKEQLKVVQEDRFLFINGPSLNRVFELKPWMMVQNVKLENGVLQILFQESQEHKKVFEIT